MHRYRQIALVAAAYLGTFLASISISIVNVALPTLQVRLDIDISGLQWVVSTYTVALSAFMLSAGPLADRFGHKRIWQLSVALFSLGSLLCACSPGIELLLWGRAIQGLAGALLIPGAMPILTDAFPQAAIRAKVIGGWSAFSALALILGPLLGGFLVERFSWQSIFWVNLPLGLLALILGSWGIDERKYPDQAAFDPLGQALSVIMLGALSYGLIESGRLGVASQAVQLSFMIALGSFVLFIWVERRVKRPLLPFSLFANGPMAAANLASFMLGFSGYASLFFLSLYLQQVQGHSPTLSGWLLMPQFLLMGIVSLLFGRVAARFTLARLMVFGYGLLGLAFCSMATFGASTPYGLIAASFSALGLAMGICVPATAMVVMGLADKSWAGTASATMNAVRQTGMTLGIALLGSAMSVHATGVLARVLQGRGMDPVSADRMARSSVIEHLLGNEPPDLISLYRAAMAQGFALVMGWAGALVLMVALLLAWRRFRAD